MLAQLSNLPSPVQRRIRLLASLGMAVLLLVIGWHLLVLLIPLLISAIAAVMLMPLMRLGERSPLARRWPRLNRLAVAILTSLLAVIIVLAVLALAAYGIIGGVETFIDAAPAIAETSNKAFERIETAYREQIPERFQETLEPRIQEYRDAFLDSGVSTLERIAGIVQSNISQMITLIATPIAIFQMLYQPKALTDALRNLIPGPLQEDLPEIGRLAGGSVMAYIRVQVLGALFVGGTIWLLYWAVGIDLALPLGMLAALTELVPIIGMTIFLLLMVIAVMLTDLGKLPLAILFFVLVQVVQNAFVTPRLQVQALGLHPVILVLSLAIFSFFFGILGALVAAPVTGAAYRVIQYTRTEWNKAGALS